MPEAVDRLAEHGNRITHTVVRHLVDEDHIEIVAEPLQQDERGHVARREMADRFDIEIGASGGKGVRIDGDIGKRARTEAISLGGLLRGSDDTRIAVQSVIAGAAEIVDLPPVNGSSGHQSATACAVARSLSRLSRRGAFLERDALERRQIVRIDAGA